MGLGSSRAVWSVARYVMGLVVAHQPKATRRTAVSRSFQQFRQDLPLEFRRGLVAGDPQCGPDPRRGIPAGEHGIDDQSLECRIAHAGDLPRPRGTGQLRHFISRLHRAEDEFLEVALEKALDVAKRARLPPARTLLQPDDERQVLEIDGTVRAGYPPP